MTAKRLSKSQITGQRGELLVGDRTLAIGFVLDIRNRLETGIDGLLELRDPVSGETQARWIGVQVKTTDSAAYSYEDATGFEYLLNPDDLAYWRRSSIPVIIVLVRLSDGSMYWKPVLGGDGTEPRRLRFDKAADRYEPAAADRIAALSIERNRLGSYVPPMLAGESGHLTMLRVRLPDEIYLATSLFRSRREAVQALLAADPGAPFAWVIRNDRFLSFQDPRHSALCEVVDAGSVAAIETEAVALLESPDDEHLFIDLLRRTLSAQLELDLGYEPSSRALYFRARGEFRPRTYRYRGLVNESRAEVVKVWRGRDGRGGSVRHHAFVPRFLRLGDEWYLTVNPTFVFTRDGYRPHWNAADLIAGKKKHEREGALRGQFVMWRHLLVEASPRGDLLSADDGLGPLGFEALPALVLPRTVPESAWKRDDPNAANLVEPEGLL